MYWLFLTLYFSISTTVPSCPLKCVSWVVNSWNFSIKVSIQGRTVAQLVELLSHSARDPSFFLTWSAILVEFTHPKDIWICVLIGLCKLHLACRELMGKCGRVIDGQDGLSRLKVQFASLNWTTDDYLANISPSLLLYLVSLKYLLLLVTKPF